MRWREIVGESASGGSSGAGGIASVPGGGASAAKGAIGVGFDPNGDWGIYNSAKKKPKAKISGSSVIKRV